LKPLIILTAVALSLGGLNPVHAKPEWSACPHIAVFMNEYIKENHFDIQKTIIWKEVCRNGKCEKRQTKDGVRYDQLSLQAVLYYDLKCGGSTGIAYYRYLQSLKPFDVKPYADHD
jgi:hypothetical protein